MPRVPRVDIGLLQGIERQKAILLENTLRFARGLPANNAMLWGARGHGQVVAGEGRACRAPMPSAPGSLALVEIHREDIRTLPELLDMLRAAAERGAAWCSATTCPSSARTPTTRR